MPQTLRMISMLVALGCVVNAGSSNSTVYSCPPDFEKIEGIDHKCFHFHTYPNRNLNHTNFLEARRICKGMNSTVVEPSTFEEGNILGSMKLGGSSWASMVVNGNSFMWINYHDMEMTASLIGTEEDDGVLLDSKYMGSLTTLDKIPDEWWSPNDFKLMTPYELEKYNCLQWSREGAFKVSCFYNAAVVCEVEGSQNLKQYINNFNYPVPN